MPEEIRNGSNGNAEEQEIKNEADIEAADGESPEPTYADADEGVEAESEPDDEAEDDNEESDDKSAAKPSLRSEIFEWVEMFALYFAVGITVLLVFFRHCPVSGDSMLPTLVNGDMLIVTSFLYTPEQGDIIVCQSPTYTLDSPLVKRIIATEGQTVTIDYKSWTVTVDGVTLDEDYINYIPGVKMLGTDYLPESFTVPEGKVFVMGDNRNDSLDSRSSTVGFIDERYIVGKVAVRIYPFSEFKIF